MAQTAHGHGRASVLLGLRPGLATMRLGGPWASLLGLPTAVVYGSLALFCLCPAQRVPALLCGHLCLSVQDHDKSCLLGC